MINRTQAPQTRQITAIPLAQPEQLKSLSGIPFYVIRQIPENTVKLTLEFNAGKIHQPSALVAGFTADLLFSGTAGKSQQEIQEEFDYYGGYVQAEMGMERSTVTIYGLIHQMDKLIELTFEALQGAEFPEREFEQHRNIELQKFRINWEKVATRVRKYFSNALFEGTPFDNATSEDDFSKVTRSQCREFHQTRYLKGLIDVNIVGNLTDKQLQSLMIRLDGWKNAFNESVNFSLKSNSGLRSETKEGALQTAIRVGKILFTPQHEDYMAFDVLNTLLGGYFGSRLMSNIREDKGYTYGIGSGVVNMKAVGYFFISTEVGVEVKEDTLKEIRYEIERLQTELVDCEELDLVKNYLIGQVLKGTDGPFAMMNQFLFIHDYGLPDDYLSRYVKTVQSVTPEELRSLANRYLDWESMNVIEVG
jgi:zinc protease